jgi:GAF domain-containing protein
LRKKPAFVSPLMEPQASSLDHELRNPGGLSAEVEHLTTERRRFEQHLLDVGSPGILALAWYWIHRMQARYFIGDYANAKAAKAKAEEISDATRTFIDIAEYHFYGALILSRSCEIQSAEMPQCDLDELRAHYRQVSAWADHCPENFAARATLIAAEIARIEKRDLVAIQKYEEAVRLARDYGFTQVEGVANELAARFHAARGLETAADAYLRGARACYRRWGAETKVTQIDRDRFGSADTSSSGAPEAEAFIKYDQLDIAAVIEMSQAVSSEIVLDQLVERLMKSVVEHAGAVRGVLLLHMDGRVRPIAEAVAAMDGVVVHRLLQPKGSLVLPEAILNFVMRTHEPLILTNAQAPNLYSADPYIRDGRARSILCMPLLKQTQLIGMLYLENDLLSDVFTPARLALLQILASQASISIENGAAFRRCSDRTRARTAVSNRATPVLRHDSCFGLEQHSRRVAGIREQALARLHWHHPGRADQ